MKQARPPVVRCVPVAALMLVLAGAAASAVAGELTPDEQAQLVLNSARKGYNERNYPFAIERFREFIQKFGGHKDAASAHYGLGLALIEGPAKDYQNAFNSLGQAAGREDFADRPFAFHYMGVARRAMGYALLAQADAKPAEAQALRGQAKQQFEEAGRSFASAAGSFAGRVKTPPVAKADLPEDLQWAARARCDQAEMVLRTDKFKEAADLAEGLLADAALGKSRYRTLALYHLGYAKFALRDYLTAGRALSQLAPFSQEYGIHARYLLGRTHHLADERAEALTQYKAVLAAYDEQKKAAQAALGNPAALAPDQREFLEALVKNPPPEYVLRSLFYLSLLQAEDGRFAEALAGFAALVQQFPQAALVPEAQLRIGFCQMQLKNYPEAIKSLQPLAEHPQLGDQALWWLARSQAGAADPANAPAYEQAVRQAIELLRRAADRANQLAQNDPVAKLRRGDILIETADTMQLVRMHREAAGVYEQVVNEKLNPDRAEEAMQRGVTALHLAALYRESDEAAKRFEQLFPKSTLLPAVLFRTAENAFLAATTAATQPNRPSQEELTRLFTEAITRYQRLLKQFPEFPPANLARHGMGASLYRLGKFQEAIDVLTTIPEMERTGDLATVSYLMADCLIRTLPPEADDALQAARQMEQAERAAKLLEGFAAAQPKSPQAPDAMLKLGYCQQRIGAALADPAERQKALAQARTVYEAFMQQFPQDPALPSVVFERAKCLALLGDPGNATNELGRFRADPFRNSPVAPLALVRLSALLRAQGKATDAVAVMAECRTQHEGRLQQDPARSDWVPLVQYELALATKESGKLPEARALFEQIAKQFGGRPEATNSQWRAAQCRREELVAALAAARANVAKPGAKPEEITAARTAIAEGLKGVGAAVDFLKAQVAELAKNAAGTEAHQRALYELAWCGRVLAEAEIEAARMKLQAEAVQKIVAKLAQNAPAGMTPQELRPPDVPLADIPVQPSEKLAIDSYMLLIVAAPETPVSVQARLELAELRAGRGDPASALDLLADALEKNPSVEAAERIRLRLAVVLLSKGDPKAALAQTAAVAKNQATTFPGEVRYLTAEAYLQQKDWGKAIEQLLPFRDQGPFQNVPNVSDRALLRLGHAYAQAGQWDQARTSFETLVQRFGQSPWVDEARYNLGFAWQTMKQLDQAVNNYTEVTRRTVSLLGAKAQLQLGLCRLEQKNFPEAARNLLVVPYTYDYPELNATALCQAAQAYVGLNQPAEAAKLWQRVVKEHPNTEWAKAAEQGLAALQPAPAPAPPPKK